MVEQRFKLGTANAINEYGNYPILDNDKGLSLIEVINILNEYDAVFKSIDRLTDEEGGAIEYDTPNAAYYVFYHRVSGFKRCIPPNVILGTIKGLHKKIEEQQATIQRFEEYVFSDERILCYNCLFCQEKDIYEVKCKIKGSVDVHGICQYYEKKGDE